MSGPDTIRGFNFQHAAALHAALDLLDDPDSERIEIEGDDDVIDFQSLGAGDVRRRVAQIKSRATPVGPQEIIDVIRRWRQLPASEQAQFEYVTDAHLGRQAATKLVMALRRLAEGQALDADQEVYLRTRGLGDDYALLARVRVVAQHPPLGALLTQAEMRMLRLVGSHRPVSADDAQVIVDRLFRLIATAAGEGERNLRRLTRAQVAEVIGVGLASIDAGAGWCGERAEQYRQTMLGQPHDAAAVELGLEPVAPEAALLLVEGRAKTTRAEPAERVVELLDEAQGAALVGRGGAGKSTALQELAVQAAGSGLLPITPDLVAYRAGSLRRLLHQELEAHLEGPIGPRGLDVVLASSDAVVLLDGVTERPGEEAADLLQDVAELRRDWPVRVIATGRRTAQLRAIDSPIYELRGLDWKSRERVAEAVMEDGAEAARALADRLGDATEVPLLFRMGLSLLAHGRDPASVEQLYGEFVSGLAARAGVVRPDAALAAAGLCCLELVAQERFAADAYWWRSSMRAALDALAASGIFELGGVSAESAIASLVEIGLVHERGAAVQLGLLHDGFRDYLAARALIDGHAPLPEPLDERYELVADLVAQGTPKATPELVLRLCDNPVAAARAAELDVDVHEPSRELAQMLLRHLLAEFALPQAQLPEPLGLTEWSGEQRFYVAVHEGDGRICEAVEEFEDAVERALVIAAYPQRPPALRIVVRAWQELLREQLRRAAQSGRPRPIPDEPEPLAAAVAAHFKAKREAVAGLAEAVCPALSERIVETVGWRGLDARLDAEERLDEMRGCAVHTLTYTHNSDHVAVKVAGPDDEFRGEAHTIAEYFMHEAPEVDATNAVASALKKLLVAWGP